MPIRSWNVLRYVLLLVLVITLGWTIRARLGGWLHLTASSVQTPWRTEREWISTQIVGDLTGMVARARGEEASRITIVAPSVPEVWQPAAYAAAVAPHLAGREQPAAPAIRDVHARLVNLDADSLLETSLAVSAALTANARDARAHEAAALTVGAFALREAAAEMTDARWALNRMTVHLAMAGALGSDAPGPDGQLATIVLLALSNRQQDALALLDGLDAAAGATEVASSADAGATEVAPDVAWRRALRMRITQDWRQLPNPPAATRLEKLEYFRARRATVYTALAHVDLDALHESNGSDWSRIVASHPKGIEDGHEFVTPAIDRELAEASQVHRALRNGPLPAALHEALNARAPGLVSERGIEVLPWGAWAEFHQRHLAMNVDRLDRFLRHSLGSRAHAEDAKRELDARLGRLTLFPVGACRRTTGSKATEGDLEFLPEATDVLSEAPELVNAANWHWLEFAQKYEPSARRLPPAAQWFAAPTPQTPYEAATRLKVRTPGLLDALAARAPYDRDLLFVLLPPPGSPVSSPTARAGLDLRLDYDLKAIDAAAERTESDAELVPIQRRACELGPVGCAHLGWTLARMGDARAAAAEFERAFAHPSMDAVGLANHSSWLVNHYFEQKRIREALALAEASASTGAWAGMVTSAYLHERLDDQETAHELYAASATRYENDSQLLGYYYRQVVARGRTSLKPDWEAALARRFPKGLQPLPASMDTAPKTGVVAYTDNARARAAGLRAGDIIVGLEGWRVENVEQYTAINAFFEKPELKITIWRGQLKTIEATVPGRRFGIDLQTHPLKGWILD